MSDKIEEIKLQVEKLSLQPNDLLIVRDEADMSMFLEMTQQGIGFTPYANPVLLVKGGLEKASRQDLIEALSVIDQVAADKARTAVTDAASRIITDINAPFLKRVQ
jgi:hypothetical protein